MLEVANLLSSFVQNRTQTSGVVEWERDSGERDGRLPWVSALVVSS